MQPQNQTQKLKKLDHVTLAEGETTGHSHRAVGGTLFEDADGTLVLERGETTVIQHEEHGPITLPELHDLFDVRKVQEMDHAANAARSVVD